MIEAKITAIIPKIFEMLNSIGPAANIAPTIITLEKEKTYWTFIIHTNK